VTTMFQTARKTTSFQFNVLVSRSHRAYLADFGVATIMESSGMTYMSTDRSKGTLRWQAPELFPDMAGGVTAGIEQRNTFATDIYAFALVCYEASMDIKSQFALL
jgi:serine/threonine protein kinase